MEVNKTNSGIPKFLQVKYAAALNRKRTRYVTVKCVCVFLGGFFNVGVVGGGGGGMVLGRRLLTQWRRRVFGQLVLCRPLYHPHLWPYA